MSDPIAHARVWLFPVEEGAANLQGFAQMFQNLLGLPAPVTGIVIGAALLAIGLSSREMRRSYSHIFWGSIVGLAVISGWVGTFWIAQNGFAADPIETHTFAAPIGDTIYYAMTASGNSVSFSVGSVLGVIIGATLGSYSKGHFRWEACDDPRELGRQIAGAAMMGAGAILAVGCSIGQGISAFSVLAYSAPVASAAIFAGAALGLRQLIVGHLPAE